ncbi:hypothetical protein EW145_g675 [Phellinidium pouzarii]|uniref:ELYS-like domain-containing protein n=1 Tax=Phellinidium pouzarii TaxID=167371 RepID=A0A4S4LI36_9AGAM|nr:hypothetical protein EW145_g675 [Phellinidium pouzarii]
MDDDPLNDYILYFGVRSDEFAWRDDACDQVRARRAAMSGSLFFDMLLQLGGIEDAQNIYPPPDLRSLYRLLEAVKCVSFDSMKRHCLVYYLLKWHMDGREVGFVSEKVISPHYAALADVYWLLDTGLNLDNAVSKLADVRIVKDYTTKIIETLALDPESGRLIRKFVRTCNPALRDPVDLERYLIATAEYSIVEAWQYQRRFSDQFPARKDLIRKLLMWTLAPKPRPQSLTQLLSVPFSKYEDSVVQDFAMHPPEDLPIASTALVRDMVCVRLIQSCKYVAACKFDRQYPSSGASPRGTWGAERERIIKEVISIMPAVERTMLESELESLGESIRPRTASTRNSWSNLGASGSTDLGASWEDIGRRATGAPRRSMGGRPISSRAPRTSLPNGSAPKPSLFTPGASTSSIRQHQPLSAHPMLVSQADTSSSLFDSFTSPPMRLSTQRPSGAAPPKAATNGVNGKANGISKTNAFMARNAFFEPPERSSSPEIFEMNGSAQLPLPKRSHPQSSTRLPTPPQDEPEVQMQESRDEEDGDSAKSVSDELGMEDKTVESEREDFGFSLFSSAPPVSAARLTPPSGTVSPKGNRRSQRISHDQEQREEGQGRRALRLSVPGAFVLDDEHELQSPTIATGGKESISESHRAQPPTGTGRRSSRKRAASPDDSLENTSARISMPGALFKEDEDDIVDNTAEHANGHTHVQENGLRSEEADELAPLPSQRSRRKAPATTMTGTRQRASRGGSIEHEDGDRVTGRPVRRSTRLSTASSSPNGEKKNPRPRKSTRTSGPGATATGRGATKRR